VPWLDPRRERFLNRSKESLDSGHPSGRIVVPLIMGWNAIWIGITRNTRINAAAFNLDFLGVRSALDARSCDACVT